MKDLSSSMTFTYKFVLPIIWILIILSLTAFIFWDSHEFGTFLMLLMIMPILIFLKLKRVSYDENNVYISNWRTKWTYELKKVKAINEGNIAGLDPFFELEIIEENGELKKIDFIPKVYEQLNYTLTGQFTGRILELRNKINNKKLNIN